MYVTFLIFNNNNLQLECPHDTVFLEYHANIVFHCIDTYYVHACRVGFVGWFVLLHFLVVLLLQAAAKV